MKKGYLIGSVAVLGAIVLFAWYKTPKKNSEGFFNAQGKSGGCAQCESSTGGYYGSKGKGCKKGDRCIANYA